MISLLIKLRRWLLRNLIPEAMWPKNVLLDNVSIPVRGMPYSYGVKKILQSGSYESNERCLLNRVIRTGDVVFEFGGSIGILATIASEKVCSEGFVVSVEACSGLAKHSKLRLAGRSNVKILAGFGFPVSSVPDAFQAGVLIDEGNSLGGRIDFSNTVGASDEARNNFDINRMIVECRRDPDILLIDIEGSETVFLDDTAKIPECVKYIIIEMHPGIYQRETESRIIQRICSFGFTVIEEISHVFLLGRIARH